MEGCSRGVDNKVDHQLAEVLRQRGEACHAYDHVRKNIRVLMHGLNSLHVHDGQIHQRTPDFVEVGPDPLKCQTRAYRRRLFEAHLI